MWNAPKNNGKEITDNMPVTIISLGIEKHYLADKGKNRYIFRITSVQSISINTLKPPKL
jgi:hypothetical protein